MNRSVLILAAAVVVLVAGLYWQMSSRPTSSTPAVALAPETTPVEPSPSAKAIDPVAKEKKATVPAVDDVEALPKWEPNTAEYNHKIDVVVGDKFRAFGAKACDESGLDPDGIVRIKYKLRIQNSVVSATNIKATGERGAEKLARCIEDSMQNATFRLPRMPDFEEDDSDLFIRVKTLRKYRSRAEFDE